VLQFASITSKFYIIAMVVTVNMYIVYNRIYRQVYNLVPHKISRA